MENSIAQQLINKFNEHGSFIDLYGIVEAFNQDKNKSLIILSEFLTEQDAKNKTLLEEIERLKEANQQQESDIKRFKSIQSQETTRANELQDEVDRLKSDLKAAESVNEQQRKLNESALKYIENQRKIIVLLLEGIEEVKGHLPFATNLKLTEIVNASQVFTKPLHNSQKQG